MTEAALIIVKYALGLGRLLEGHVLVIQGTQGMYGAHPITLETAEQWLSIPPLSEAVASPHL